VEKRRASSTRRGLGVSAATGSRFGRENLRFFVVSGFVLAAAVLAVYWEVLRYPFIQDDWWSVRAAMASPLGELLRGVFNPFHQLFYRPLGMTYFFLYERVFGLNPLAFHVINLAVHVTNSVLILAVALLVSRSRSVALATAVLYATAATVHLDPLLWMVGIYDLMGACCFFSGLLLFILGKPRLSGLSYLLGLLFKESVLLLPVVLLAWLLWEGEEAIRRRKGVVRNLSPHLCVLVVYLSLKLLGLSPFGFASSFPYHIALSETGFLRNLLDYSTLGLGVLVPFSSSGRLAAVIVVVVLAALGASAKIKGGSPVPAHWPFLSLWVVAGIALALPLVNHWYRYYLTYSFPAGVLIVLLTLRQSYGVLYGRQRVAAIFLVCWLAVQTLSAGVYVFRRDKAGISAAYEYGTNNLIYQGNGVIAVFDYLQRTHPSVPNNTVFIIDGVWLAAFGDASAFCAFYREGGITAYPSARVELGAGGAISLRPVGPDKGRAAEGDPTGRPVIYLRVGPKGVQEEKVRWR
jgi:hypothetical protein